MATPVVFSSVIITDMDSGLYGTKLLFVFGLFSTAFGLYVHRYSFMLNLSKHYFLPDCRCQSPNRARSLILTSRAYLQYWAADKIIKLGWLRQTWQCQDEVFWFRCSHSRLRSSFEPEPRRIPTQEKLHQGTYICFMVCRAVAALNEAVEFQSWKRLSRLQRSLIYFASVILFLTTLYFAWLKDGLMVDDQQHQKLAVVTEHDLSVKDQEDFRREVIPPNLDVIDVPKNKVEAVHKVLEEKIVDADENQAHEDYEDERMYDKVDDDSNQAVEKGVNEDVDTKQRPPQDLRPPKDGSLVFRGPTNERQTAVVDAFKHAWSGYKTYAWGHDHLKPISKGAQNWFGLGLTLIDSLDTLYIMNLDEEFELAKEWVTTKLNFSINKVINYPWNDLYFILAWPGCFILTCYLLGCQPVRNNNPSTRWPSLGVSSKWR